jgi:hypothetical protein
MSLKYVSLVIFEHYLQPLQNYFLLNLICRFGEKNFKTVIFSLVNLTIYIMSEKYKLLIVSNSLFTHQMN